jgi:hypothetical protein
MSIVRERLFRFGLVLAVGFLLLVGLVVSAGIRHHSGRQVRLKTIQAVTLRVIIASKFLLMACKMLTKTRLYGKKED